MNAQPSASAKKIVFLFAAAIAAASAGAAAADLEPYATIRFKSFDSLMQAAGNVGILSGKPEASVGAIYALAEAKDFVEAKFDSTRPISVVVAFSKPCPSPEAIAAEGDDGECLEAFGESIVLAAAFPISERYAKAFFLNQGVEDWTNSTAHIDCDDFYASYKNGRLVLSLASEGGEPASLVDSLLKSAAAPSGAAQVEIICHAPMIEIYKNVHRALILNPENFAEPRHAELMEKLPALAAVFPRCAQAAASNELAKYEQLESVSAAIELSLESGITADFAFTLKPGKALSSLATAEPIDAAQLAFIPDSAKAFFAISDYKALNEQKITRGENILALLADAAKDPAMQADIKAFAAANTARRRAIGSSASFADIDSKGRVAIASRSEFRDIGANKASGETAFKLLNKASRQNLGAGIGAWISMDPADGSISFDYMKLLAAIGKKTGGHPGAKSAKEKREALEFIASFFGEKLAIKSRAANGVAASELTAEGSDYKFGATGAAARQELAKLLPAESSAKPLAFGGIELSSLFAGVYNRIPKPEYPGVPDTLEFTAGAPALATAAAWLDKNAARVRLRIPASEIRNLAAFANELAPESYDDWDYCCGDEYYEEDEEDGGEE
jgi:hypothetical protein